MCGCGVDGDKKTESGGKGGVVVVGLTVTKKKTETGGKGGTAADAL